MEKKFYPLTEYEENELKCLEDNKILYLNSPTGMGGVIGGLFSPQANPKKIERIAELRTKKRMFELKLNPDDNWQEYYKIRGEEEKRAEELLNKK